jgi:hypothetical protein
MIAAMWSPARPSQIEFTPWTKLLVYPWIIALSLRLSIPQAAQHLLARFSWRKPAHTKCMYLI